MTHRVFFFIAMLAVAVGCDRSTPTSDLAGPVAPSPIATTPTSAAPAAQVRAAGGRQDVLVNMQDACDPTTFNAAIGAGTCVRAGGVQFSQFIAELTRLGFAGAWHFAPPTANVRVGQSFLALNKGGEVHTFTEVDDFGGGIVPVLNDLAHVPTVAPECAALEPDDFVAPGGSYREEIEHTGALKFQCCIHPWMRFEATVVK
jgi:plastocyanin